MNAALSTDGITITQRALSSRSFGMLSGTFRISVMTAAASRRRSSSFALCDSLANEDGANASTPIITIVHLYYRLHNWSLLKSNQVALRSSNQTHSSQCNSSPQEGAMFVPVEEIIAKWRRFS